MKVLHINTFNQQGGAETIAYALFKSRIDNSLVVKKNSGGEKNIFEFRKTHIDKFFDLLSKLKWRYKPNYSFKKIFFLEEEFNCTYKKLKELDAYKSADIIHLHNIHGGYFDLNSLKKIAKEKKIVWTLHDMWCMTGGEAHIFENENFKIGIGKTPYIHVPPLNSPFIDRRQHFLDLKKKIYEEISSDITFVPASNWLNDCLLNSYVWNDKLLSVVIHNGIDSNIFFRNRSLNYSTPKILVFSNNNIFKGENLFKEVLEQITLPFELYIIGKTFSIENKNLSKVFIMPPVKDRSELAKLYNTVDILLFPSKSDNFPLVPLEAMACGVCVFASNVGGIPEMIDHNKTGFLFNEILELILMLNHVLKHPEKIAEIGSNASLDIINKFPLDKMIKEYVNIYSNLLK